MPKVVILFTDPSPLWYESIRHTFILAHHVTPLKGGWVHSISLGHFETFASAELSLQRCRSPALHLPASVGVLSSSWRSFSGSPVHKSGAFRAAGNREPTVATTYRPTRSPDCRTPALEPS